MRAGLPFSTSPGTAYEHTELRLRVARPDRGPRVRHATATSSALASCDRSGCRPPTGTRPMCPPAGARMGIDGTARRGRGGPAGRWLLRRDGWTADFGRDLGRYIAFMLSGVAAARRRGQRAGERSSVREMQQGQRLSGLTATPASPSAPMTASTRAYAYGLASISDCSYRFLVSHGGGLPGFGSSMTWLPELRGWRLRDGERDLRRPGCSRARGAGSSQRDRRAAAAAAARVAGARRRSRARRLARERMEGRDADRGSGRQPDAGQVPGHSTRRADGTA
mgnify:CR=1 FL=1